MISLDTNVLFNAFKEDAPWHTSAFDLLTSLADRSDIAISEFVLVELYRLLRNPVVVPRPLSASEAVSVLSVYRSHPRWKMVGFPRADSDKLHDDLWRVAGKDPFAYRRVYDARLALTLIHCGVTDFATANVKDFENFGFRRVWNPLAKT